MTSEQLFRCFGDIDDQYIELSADEAIAARKRRQHKRAAALGVLCATAIAVVGFWTVAGSGRSLPIRYPDENVVCSLGTAADSFDTVHYRSYRYLFETADYVVCGQVVNTFYHKAKYVYQPYAEVVVTEVLKGEALSEGDHRYVKDNGIVYFETAQGGLAGRQSECGGPLMEIGNCVLLFLSDSSKCTEHGAAPLVTEDGKVLDRISSETTGKFFLDRDGLYHPSASYGEWFSINYRTSEMLDDYTPRSLEDIKEIICSPKEEGC